MFSGTGVVVSADGLILTNAHVVDPAGFGEVLPAPIAGYGIAIVDNASEPAEARYIATVVDVHPTIDAALIRIVADVDGQTPPEIHTGVLPIGDSDALASGTHAHQLGFPGRAESNEISIAEVTIQNFSPLLPCSDPASANSGSCSAGDTIDDGLMNHTGADFGRGSSGGPFVVDGELVAINVGARPDDVATQKFAIPVHTIADFLADNGIAVPTQDG